jgi:2-polyprenyl-3-methyl-5-hydroxy-6-metoxy-1,4-benzoquinol methylase
VAAASGQNKLSAIARHHSYEAGFNGRLGKYRIQMIDENTRAVSASAKVLEIGAGEGPVTEYLSGRFAHVDAIEPADAFFAKLSERFNERTNVTLHHGLFETLELNEKYPLIVASGVLEHVEKPPDFLGRILAQLAPAGIFVGTVPNATSLHRRLGVQMGMLKEVHELSEQDHKVGHYRYYDFSSLRVELESAGFSVTGIEGIVLKPFPNSKMDELSEEFCDALFQVGRELPDWGAEIFFCAKRGI